MTRAAWRLAGGFAAVALLAAAAVGGWQWHQRHARDIPVLMYHNVLPADEVRNVWQVTTEEFARQMDDLKRAGYTTILPEDISRAARGKGWLPRKPVCITFDDGYEGVMRCAEPVLAAHGFKAICYVIVRRLGEEGAERPVFDSGPLMTTNEAVAMHRRGTVEIGVHSLTHTRSAPGLALEASVGRWVVEKEMGIPRARHYCYPYGNFRQDYMRAAVEEGKYRTATVCEDQMFHYGPEADLLAIPRLSVYGGVHDIRVESVDAAAGTVTVRNEGTALPLKAVLRDGAGRIVAETETVRVGGKEPAILRSPGPFPENCTVELWDANGLFRYSPDRSSSGN